MDSARRQVGLPAKRGASAAARAGAFLIDKNQQTEQETKMAGPTSFKTELIKVAGKENGSFSALRRGDQQLEERIEFYCRSAGVPATPAVKLHYSAVFISWCMRAAGASATEFPAVAAHCQYAELAVRNFENEEGLFWAMRIDSYAPQPGDLVHVNRDGGEVNYDRISAGPYVAESGIVVGLSQGEALIVMGNQEPLGNIGTEKLALDKSGLLIQRARNPFICVIEVWK
jgi:hypothetical protein